MPAARSGGHQQGNTAAEADLVEPTIDPNTRNLNYRNVVARNGASGKTVVSVRDSPGLVTDEPTARSGTNEDPTLAEIVMGGLCGYDAVITHLIAGPMDFECGDIDYVCDAEIDPRGVHGVEGFRPYFEKVTFKKAIKTNEPEDCIERLKKNVERRCPANNLIRDAGVDLYIDVGRRADVARPFSGKRKGPALGQPFFLSVENALSA